MKPFSRLMVLISMGAIAMWGQVAPAAPPRAPKATPARPAPPAPPPALAPLAEELALDEAIAARVPVIVTDSLAEARAALAASRVSLEGARVLMGDALDFDLPMPAIVPMPPAALGAYSAINTVPAIAPFPAMGILAQADRETVLRAREMAAQDRARETDDRAARYYRSGQRSIDEKDYERAVEYFSKVIEAKSSRTDGALYWKAYALRKLGKREEGLAALAELEKNYAKSGWINDARALQVELRQASGERVSPEAEQDEDLKLFAINSLIHSDPERAIPLVEKILNDPNKSVKLKERGLFVLAQSRNPKSREVLTRYAKAASNPDLQLKAVEYLGTFGAPENRQILMEIYSNSADVNVRRAVLRGLMTGKDIERLTQVAKSEQNPQLRREAVQYLGIAGGQDQLVQLYASEQSADVKEAILRGLMLSKANTKIADVARTEKDPKLRRAAIQNLSIQRDAATPELLKTMYSAESDNAIKAEIIRGLYLQGSAKTLADIARAEKDTGLRREAIQHLSTMKSKDATDFMMELLEK
jgi:tetratricopeptide (TPR) repeat protein